MSVSDHCISSSFSLLKVEKNLRGYTVKMKENITLKLVTAELPKVLV